MLSLGVAQPLEVLRQGLLVSHRGERLRLRDQSADLLKKGQLKGCRYDEEMVPMAPKKRNKLHSPEEESLDMFVDDTFDDRRFSHTQLRMEVNLRNGQSGSLFQQDTNGFADDI